MELYLISSEKKSKYYALQFAPAGNNLLSEWGECTTSAYGRSGGGVFTVTQSSDHTCVRGDFGFERCRGKVSSTNSPWLVQPCTGSHLAQCPKRHKTLLSPSIQEKEDCVSS